MRAAAWVVCTVRAVSCDSHGNISTVTLAKHARAQQWGPYKIGTNRLRFITLIIKEKSVVNFVREVLLLYNYLSKELACFSRTLVHFCSLADF